MLKELKQHLTGPNRYLTDSYRFKILRRPIAWIGTGMEIYNSSSRAKILSPNKKAVR